MALHRGLLKVALVLVLVAVAALLLGFQMTDIGHFAGFAATSVLMLIGAGYVLWNARNGPDF